MPGIDRTTILTGPALVTFAGQSFWSKGDVTVNLVTRRFGIQTAHFGEVDSRVSDRQIEVSFEPSGRYTAGLYAVMWPYAATAIGASIYGATDRALVIWSRDGQKLTVPNASITQMPGLRLGVAQTIAGNIQFTGLLKKSTDTTSVGAYYVLASETYPGDTGFDVANIPTQPYVSVWGASAPWDSFLTEGGWEVNFAMQLAPQAVDSFGTVDMTLQGLTVTARAIPVGPAASDIFSALYQGNLGDTQGGTDLELTAATANFTLKNAIITESGFGYGNTRKRISQTTWQATRTVTAGVVDPLFVMGGEF